MRFSDWLKLKEDAGVATPASSATLTTSVTGFARPLFMVRRDWPNSKKKV